MPRGIRCLPSAGPKGVLLFLAEGRPRLRGVSFPHRGGETRSRDVAGFHPRHGDGGRETDREGYFRDRGSRDRRGDEPARERYPPRPRGPGSGPWAQRLSLRAGAGSGRSEIIVGAGDHRCGGLGSPDGRGDGDHLGGSGKQIPHPDISSLRGSRPCGLHDDVSQECGLRARRGAPGFPFQRAWGDPAHGRGLHHRPSRPGPARGGL